LTFFLGRIIERICFDLYLIWYVFANQIVNLLGVWFKAREEKVNEKAHQTMCRFFGAFSFMYFKDTLNFV